MTNYTKPLEIFDTKTKEVTPCKIVYENVTYIVVEYKSGSIKEFIRDIGIVSSSYRNSMYDTWVLRNAEPKVTREVWVNLYKDGSIGVEQSSKEKVDLNRASGHSHKRCAYFVTKEFSDGSVTNEIILIQE